jgi:hypothetical protein
LLLNTALYEWCVSDRKGSEFTADQRDGVYVHVDSFEIAGITLRGVAAAGRGDNYQVSPISPELSV